MCHEAIEALKKNGTAPSDCQQSRVNLSSKSRVKIKFLAVKSWTTVAD